MWIYAPHCAVYTVGFWHLLLVLRLQNWGGFTEESNFSLAWATICSVRSCWGTLECPTLFLFLLAPASDGYALFILTHLLSKHNYSAFAGAPRPRQGLSTVADLSGMCHPRTPSGCVVLERSVLLALWALCAVSLTLSTLNSALPDLILRQLFLWSPCYGDQTAEVAFPSFLGRGTSWWGFWAEAALPVLKS